ncbi:unnamed protein product [Durusdinium trenchii]|uniref:Uncharacterized protein n=1 Tax=Durusdinium trenchii TaxID=1381693 RepID=A0ABP0P4L6_9DINO
MVAVAAGGGLLWRRTDAKEASNFLPNLQVDSATSSFQTRFSAAIATSAVDSVAKSISSALGAVQDGMRAQIEKPFVGDFLQQNPLLADESFGEPAVETHGSDEHLLKYGGRLLGGSTAQDGDRMKKAAAAQETLVRQATILDGCLDGGQYLPVFYMLKDEMVLSPVDISLTLGFTATPFIFKPGLAVASDRMPIFGRKRTPYLAGSMLLVAGTYAGASLAQSYAGLLGFLSLNTFSRCLMSAVLQGMVVEVARQQGRDEVSAVVGDFFGLKTCAALFSAFCSSLLIGKMGSRSALRVYACAPILMLAGIGRCEQAGGACASVLSERHMWD